MDKMLIAVYDDATGAYEGSRVLQRLHDEGSITLYGEAVVVKDAEGVARVVQSSDERGPLGTAVGLLSGSLIGLIGGPTGMVVGGTVGSIGGLGFDMDKVGVGLDFLEDACKQLAPGKAAVVAEIEEDWELPVDLRMEAIGGRLIRRSRREFIHTQIERDVDAFKAEMARLQAEFEAMQARADQDAQTARERLRQKIEAIKAKLHEAQARVRASLEQIKQEADAKVHTMQEQAAKARAERRQEIERREAETRAELDERIALLERAWKLTEEALAPTPRR